jgi:hypothetical protein
MYSHFISWISKNHENLLTADSKDVNLNAVSEEELLTFFGHICKKRKRKSDLYLDPVQYQTVEYVSSFKSAIKFHYKKQRVPFPDAANDRLAEFFGGYERKIASLKRSGDMSLIEGKQPISFRGYGYLSKRAFLNNEKDSSESSIFAHVFVTLCWNLLARCNSVATLMFNHLSWEEDALVVAFPSHKGDQEGRNSLPKHVYANPLNPEVCPILALAIYIFTISYRQAGSATSLFGGKTNQGSSDVENRFSRWLKTVCAENEQELLAFFQNNPLKNLKKEELEN